MDELKYRCLKCGEGLFNKYSTLWICRNCKTVYMCFNGMPKLYLESQIGEKDKSLRDYFYNGVLGRFYQFLMPFLTLPARPIKISKKDWLIYFLVIVLFLLLVHNCISLFFNFGYFSFGYVNLLSLLFLIMIISFLIKHPYFFYLLLLAIPVKISLTRKKYKAKIGFKNLHEEIIQDFLSRKKTLQILDISTGTGNSLLRHGWKRVDAEFTGLDLSETMLAQCQTFMANEKIPINLVLGDATDLPFKDNYFDIVLNYGAINGYSNIKKAIEEMIRVVKGGGTILFLDEQLYPSASSVEKFYFKKVLSSHNIIHSCPVDLIPDNIGTIDVYQVYEFYYICTIKVIK